MEGEHKDVSPDQEGMARFLSMIAHDLRTPLTTIKGAVEVLDRSGADLSSDLASEMLGMVKRGTERLERVMMDLIVVARIDAGSLSVISEEFELRELVAGRIESVITDGILVIKRFDDDDIVVKGDYERLAHSIDHLLDNARKFGGRGGTIVVEVRHTPEHASVSVSDQGPGIARDDQERIFDRFVSLPHESIREGTGVGLYIARHCIERMNGTLSVETAPGKGATFRITLPLAEVSPPQ